MSQRRLLGMVISICLFVALLSVGMFAYSSGGPFSSIHVASNRSSYTGKACPIKVIFTASINFQQPHGPFEFNYHWERSDGGKSETQVVSVPKSKKSIVIREEWSLGSPGMHYDAFVTLHVNSGNTHLSERSPVVKINCK